MYPVDPMQTNCDDMDFDLLEMLTEFSNDGESFSNPASNSPSTNSEDCSACSDNSDDSSEKSFSSDSSQTSFNYVPTADQNLFNPNKPMLFSVKFEDPVDNIKRCKREVKLLKNRESANKSRAKKRKERQLLECSMIGVKARVKDLEQENAALLADNSFLHSENAKLRKELMELKEGASKYNQNESDSHSVTGVSVLCLVFTCSFFGNFPPVNNGITIESAKVPGRVLMSLEDDTSMTMMNPQPSPYFNYDIDNVVKSDLLATIQTVMFLVFLGLLCWNFVGKRLYISLKNKTGVLPS